MPFRDCWVIDIVEGPNSYSDLRRLVIDISGPHSVVRVTKVVLVNFLRIYKQTRWQQLLQIKYTAHHVSRLVYVCYYCWSFVGDDRGLQYHRRWQHGVYCPARYFVKGGTCLRCGVIVHTIPRLIHHLNQGATDCLAWYISNAPIIQKRRTH